MAKTKKKRIPKTIAGVKLPKELRRAGEALIDQASSPAGRRAIAGTLSTLATLAAARASTPARDATPSSPDRAPTPPPPADATQIVDAMSSAATAFMTAFLRPKG